MAADAIPRPKQVLTRRWHIVPPLDHHPRTLQVTKIAAKGNDVMGGRKFLWCHTARSIVRNVHSIRLEERYDCGCNCRVRLGACRCGVQQYTPLLSQLLTVRSGKYTLRRIVGTQKDNVFTQCIPPVDIQVVWAYTTPSGRPCNNGFGNDTRRTHASRDRVCRTKRFEEWYSLHSAPRGFGARGSSMSTANCA